MSLLSVSKPRNKLFSNSKQTLDLMWTDSKNRELFCDVFLISGLDGKKIAAHRAVLFAANEFFRIMFSNNFKEASEKEITLADISSDILELIIEYCYTGSIYINENNAQMLLPHAAMMLFPEVVEACADFLTSCIYPGNCLSMTKYAKLHNCQHLLESAEEHMKENFINVAIGDEYLNSNLDEVLQYLSKDEICVDDEKDVFEAIIRWIDFDPVSRNTHFSKLLTTVRLHHMDKNYLLEHIVKNRDKKYLSSLLEGIEQNLYNAKVIPKRLGLKSDKIIFVYNENIKIFNEINEKIDNYSFKPCTNFKPALVGDNMIIVGLDNVQCVNLTTGTNHDLEAPKHLKNIRTVSVLNGYLYAIDEESTTVERFDVKLNKWSVVASMKEFRKFHRAAVLNGKLYTFGGCNSLNIRLNSVECYDPTKNEWIDCAPMLKCRSSASVIVANKNIFVFGGWGSDNKLLNCIEKYNAETDSWSIVSEMTRGICGVATCLLNNKIFLFGGYDGKNYVKFLEEFNPITNKCKPILDQKFDFIPEACNVYMFSYSSTNK